MVKGLTDFNAWLEATFTGPVGYTVHADGHMERGVTTDGDLTAVDADTFHQLFGCDVTVDGPHFFVPGDALNAAMSDSPLHMLVGGRQMGLMGEFRRINGQTIAVARFVWNRLGVGVGTFYIWMCLLVILLELISGAIMISQGLLTPGRAVIIGLSLSATSVMMFLPRALAALGDKLFNDLRRATIAKLSALVQHQA